MPLLNPTNDSGLTELRVSVDMLGISETLLVSLSLDLTPPCLALSLALTLTNAQVDFLEDFDPGQISDQGGSEGLKDGHHAPNGYGDLEEEEPSPYARQAY